MNITIPLMGAHFRPPAKLILANLPAETELILEPEPTNPYDPDAVRVCIPIKTIFELAQGWIRGSNYPEMEAELNACGWTLRELIALEEPLHVGYLARQQSPEHPHGPPIGNTRALELMHQSEWSAKLTFDIQGKPIVRINGGTQC